MNPKLIKSKTGTRAAVRPSEFLSFGLVALVVAGCATAGKRIAGEPLPIAAAPVATPPRLFSFAWTNAPGACLSDVWSNLSPAPLATVTNLPTGQPLVNTFTVTNRQDVEMFRVSHPVLIGHYPDGPVWRVNPKVLGL